MLVILNSICYFNIIKKYKSKFIVEKLFFSFYYYLFSYNFNYVLISLNKIKLELDFLIFSIEFNRNFVFFVKII